jgi:dihydrodipicolinate synthase/N-acetylneuraminate lyase
VKLRGIVPVVPTPFTEGEELDLEALDGLIEFACGSGVAAACLPAYASEFYKMSDRERGVVVERAVRQSAGRIAIVAQSNHPSPRIAAELARRNEAAGADVISFAIPRQFALAEGDVLRYCEAVTRSVQLPVLLQDFNPGGPTVGAEFAARLHQSAGNFQYLKLEEPMMAPKVRAIRKATVGAVGVLEGWGGMYLLELLPEGICGTMPGLAMCDLFVRVIELAEAGEQERAVSIFCSMLPQIVYSLQNMELFHHTEKRLLQARSLIRSSVVREPRLSLDSATEAYIELLNRRVLEELNRQGLAAVCA